MRYFIFVFFSFILGDLFGQSEKEGCFIVDTQNNLIKVDSAKWDENNEFPTSIKVFREGREEILTPHNIKRFENHAYGLNYVFESVFDLRDKRHDFTKTGIFLMRECSGKIDLFTLVANGSMYFCAKYNSKWTLFDSSNTTQKYLDFFKDKQLVYSNVRNLINNNNWNRNTIIDIVNYYNTPPEDYVGLAHYASLDSLCTDFMNVIKSDNNEKIEEFCKKIFINKYYNDYFKKYQFSYRGLPFSTDQELQAYISDHTKLMIKIKDMWKQDCGLDKIKLLSIDKGTVETIDFRYTIKFCGLRLKIKTNIEEDWGLGEFINVEGKWIVLFDPK